MKVIGKRKLRELEVTASGSLLAEGARFNEGLADVPGIGTTFIPKGIYRFKSADEADLHRQRCLAEGMAGLADQRR